jgi:hypothetical protein
LHHEYKGKRGVSVEDVELDMDHGAGVHGVSVELE